MQKTSNRYVPALGLTVTTLLGLAAGSAHAQVLPNGVRTIFLERGPGTGSTAMAVAFHPGFNRYYASNGGNAGFAAWVYNAAGTRVQDLGALGIDARGWNYNPNTNKLEVTTFNAAFNGLKEAVVDGSGNLTGGVNNLLATLAVAGSQSMPAYDAGRDVLYSREGNNAVNVITRATGALASNVNLDFAGAGVGDTNVTQFAIGYDRAADRVIVTDHTNDRALVFTTAGAFVGRSQLDIDVPASFNMGYANGQLFVFDGSRNGWQGYQIFEGACSSDIIDFQALEQNNGNINPQGYQYDEDGYRLTKVNSGPQLSTFGTQEGRYPGSTALFNDQISGVTTLRRIDGAVFNITSIDLANLNGGGPAPVTFTGFYPGGASVVLATDTGDPNGLPNTLNTITFPNTFCGLERLEWTQTSPFHQFDNLKVARPTRIDFEHLAQAGSGSRDVGTQIDEEGYRFTKAPGEPFNFNVFQTGSGSFPGSTSLFNNTVNGRIFLERIDGAPFDVCEIKLANLNGGGPAPVNFVGTLAGGGVVNHNTNTGDPNGLPNVLTRNVFPVSFRGLSRLEWTQVTPFHQFDDVIVACSNVSVGCPCACDYDLTTGPNLCDIFDFLAFQNGYDAGDPCSCDKDVSTGPGVCDIFDFLAFQNEYDTGCP